jgi:hypothetical protein
MIRYDVAGVDPISADHQRRRGLLPAGYSDVT